MPDHRETYVAVEGAELYVREIGEGRPIVVLHGGPDLHIGYLLPELDILGDSFRLIYYDQRGRGKSARGVKPEDITLESEIADLESLRDYFQLESIALLGHSWGGLLAMEYATRHPERVSHLILMNTAPASHDQLTRFRQSRLENTPDDMAMLRELASTSGYQEGDPDAFAAYYRVHYRSTLRQPEHLDRVVERLRASFTNDAILNSRAIELRLYDDTWVASEYDLLPRLKHLSIPTLVLHGEHDFIPIAIADEIARAIPGARFIVLSDCGHFSYVERPDAVHREIVDFFRAPTRS